MPEDTEKKLAVEIETREKYSGAFYNASTIVLNDLEGPDFFSRLLRHKLELVRRFASPDLPMLDLCCATGEHLRICGALGSLAVGLDFSLPFLKHARQAGGQPLPVACGNARKLPFADNSFGTIYSFSSLYYIPFLQETLSDLERVLHPDGHAIVELGNRRSLNHLVCMAHSETARPFHYSVGRLRGMLETAGLEIVLHERRQLFPYWGERPAWLRPLLHRRVKRLMERELRGRDLDALLCGLPLLGGLAFRQIFVCRKQRGGGDV